MSELIFKSLFSFFLDFVLYFILRRLCAEKSDRRNKRAGDVYRVDLQARSHLRGLEVRKMTENNDLPPREDLIDHVNEKCSSRLQTVEPMVDIALYVDKRDGLVRTTKIKENVEGATSAAINNAVERIKLLEKHPPRGSGTLFVHERTDKTYFSPANISSEEYEEMFKDVKLLLDEAETNSDKRDLLAEAFGCNSEISSIRDAVESAFQEDSLECLNTAGEVIRKIQQSDEMARQSNYEGLGWRNMANRFGIHEAAYNIGEE